MSVKTIVAGPAITSILRIPGQSVSIAWGRPPLPGTVICQTAELGNRNGASDASTPRQAAITSTACASKGTVWIFGLRESPSIDGVEAGVSGIGPDLAGIVRYVASVY